MKSKSEDFSKFFSAEWLWSEFKEVYLLVLPISFLFAVTFFVYNKLQVRPSYEATAVIMPKMNRGMSSMEGFLNQMGAAGVSSNLFGGMNNANSELQQFFRLLRTRNLALKALQFDHFSNEFSMPADPENPEIREEVLVARMRESLGVKMDANVIDLRFKARTAEMALNGLKAYLGALQLFLNENIITQTKNAEIFIKERLSDLAKSQDATESKLMALKTGRRSPEHPERSIQSEIMRTEREMLRITQLLDLLAKQYELAQIESKRSDPMFIVVDPAYKPLKPVGVSSRKYAFIGAFIGFLISFLLAIFYRRYRNI